MKKWQKIDEDLAHCSNCGKVFVAVELYGGNCRECREIVNEESKRLVGAAEKRTLSNGVSAAAKLMSRMQQQGKTGQKAPQVVDEFFDSIGGTKAYARLMKSEFEKAHGIGLTEAEEEAWGPSSPRVKLQWYELIARMMDKTDQNKTLDISSLQEADLEAILSDLGHKALLEDKEIRRAAIISALGDKSFRREIFLEIAKSDKQLTDEFLANAGIITLEEGDNVSPQEAYDPSSSEYNECSG
jgi:hypothetical protein